LSDLTSGRINQKLRTRDALVAAAVELSREGGEFSLSDVADRARVSRTTTYRYFPRLDMLMAQAVLSTVGGPDFQITALFGTSLDPEERVADIVGKSDESVHAHEVEYRAMLRLSLEPREERPDAVPRRAGLRRSWLTEALSPMRKRVTEDEFERLVAALSLCVGVEPDVVLRDVCALDRPTSRAVKLWAARALLRVALMDERPHV
jgi:AcrR family transcriptional regulator